MKPQPIIVGPYLLPRGLTGSVMARRVQRRMLAAGILMLAAMAITAYFTRDIRWVLCGLMLLFAAYPMAAALFWFKASMSAEAVRPGIFPVTLRLTPCECVEIEYGLSADFTNTQPPAPELLPWPEKIERKEMYLRFWFNRRHRVILIPLSMLPDSWPELLPVPTEFVH